jgi:hypothetical protein
MVSKKVLSWEKRDKLSLLCILFSAANVISRCLQINKRSCPLRRIGFPHLGGFFWVIFGPKFPVYYG